MKALRIAVLGGGVSPEHDVSLRSATLVREALTARGHEVVPVYIDRAGTWTVGRDRDELAQPALVAAFELRRKVDVVFPALHGRGGEDGAVQALIEAAGLPCALSGQRASAIGMSKALTRAAFVGSGIPMARAFVPTRREARALTADMLTQRVTAIGLRMPWFLKEEDSGSSLGVERIDAVAQVEDALMRVRALGDYWLVEEGVPGIELTCAVLGNAGSRLTAMPPVEIRPRNAKFFDYGAKYDASATEELCPAPSLSAAQRRQVEALACRAHDVLGCRGISRTDMMLHDGEPVVLETNTIPGLTPESLLPKAAKAHGLEFGALLDELLILALGHRTGDENANRGQGADEAEEFVRAFADNAGSIRSANHADRAKKL